MRQDLGPRGYAVALVTLIESCLSSCFGQLRGFAKAALVEYALPELQLAAGPRTNPERNPTDGLCDARDLLLAAEVLIIEADRLAAPGLGCDGELTSRFVGMRAYLDQRIEAAEAKAAADR